jgi:sulfotransferase
MNKIVFTAGLPRAGSTLLGAILNQNPRFSAGITNPLAPCIRSVIKETSTRLGNRQVCDIETRKRMVKSLIEMYHEEDSAEVIFNHNRTWPLALNIVKDIYPDAKLILLVRDLGWILDSFEILLRKNPYVYSRLFDNLETDTVYARCESLLKEKGTVGFAYDCVKQAITSEFSKDIMIIDYDSFVSNPKLAIENLYNFIDEPLFEHDFENVESSFDEYDEDLSAPGLHTVKRRVEFVPRKSIIPPDVWLSVEGKEVWKIQNSKNS